MLWFQEKVENGIIMTSLNGLHKSTIVIFGKNSKTSLNYGIKNGQLMNHKIKKLLNIFGNLKSRWYLVPTPFHFS